MERHLRGVVNSRSQVIANPSGLFAWFVETIVRLARQPASLTVANNRKPTDRHEDFPYSNGWTAVRAEPVAFWKRATASNFAKLAFCALPTSVTIVENSTPTP